VFKLALKVLLPLVVVGASVAVARNVIANAPELEARAREVPPPLVEVAVAEQRDVRLDVDVHGTVRPHTEIRVVPQVAGRVVYVSPSLKEGGFFRKDEVLLRIERKDYELAVTQAQALVAQAQARLDRERAEAEIAADEWEKFGKGEANPLVLRKPQLAEAQAALASAEARLAAARLNLERTEISAPYAGRVRSENVDLGQYVMVGSPVASVYATAFAEVQLFIPDDEIAFLDLPLNGGSPESVPEVTLAAVFAGREFRWTGEIDRTAAELDPRSRVVRSLVRVKDPYGLQDETRPPLLVGTYVRATIQGRIERGAIVLSSTALRGSDRVWLVDSEDRLRFRTVEVLRRIGEEVVLRSGLAAGDRVCVSPLDPAVDGMQVRVEVEEEER
jgi:RND family efflux transporter MFP subunit